MDMMSVIVVLFIALVVLLPFLLALITGYETPASFGESLRRSTQGVWGGCIAIVSSNLGRVGLDFTQWYWGLLLVIPPLIALQLFIDWLAMRREAKRTTI